MLPNTVTIIDYGMGNAGSIQNMLRKLGYGAIITSQVSQIQNAAKLILPGVGSFDNGIKYLSALRLIDILNEKVLRQGTPIMGICLGMQLMTKNSQEGKLPGLAWFEAETIKFNFDKDSSLKIPHMGWNLIKIKKKSKIFQDMYNQENRFYFVHSYHALCRNQEDILASTFYGYDFISVFERNNIVGLQFHPEKSHKFGMQVLKNFVENF